ncbi:MAG: cytochrome c3 family protein [Oryzomonas sp.]|jgi:predicted CXXCH cytochrome family protein
MAHSSRRNIGDILLDGGFVQRHDLDAALGDQKLSKELLGQVLIKRGALKADDIKVPLLIQEHLGSVENAVKLAAGDRQVLGDLLVLAGHITEEQLQQALAEQRRSGGKFGEVCKRLGLLTELQLQALLEFQRNQESTHDSPLRLGELLVATGKITREHLEVALKKQKQSDKNIGDVLIEAGYASPDSIRYGARLQRMLTRSVLAAILALGVSTASEAGEMCLLTKQLMQNPAQKARYAARVATEVGDMVAYNSRAGSTGQQDISSDTTPAGYVFGKRSNPDSRGENIDELSRDCLSCHDGVVAGNVHVTYRNTPGQRTNRYDGKSEHPIGMNYAAYAAMDPLNYKPSPAFNSKMTFVNDRVGCLTCHNPMNPEEKHLVMSDYRSALCLTCHNK